MFSKVLILFVYVLVSEAQYEGERCVKSGSYGVCKNINRCQTAIDDLKRKINPQVCSFNNTDPIVCCLDHNAASNPGTSTTRRPSTTSTTEFITPMYNDGNVGPTDSKCEPIPESRTLKKTGQKALDKCIEYQEKYVYPCEKGLEGELGRSNKCHQNWFFLEDTDDAFPHMVMVGYGANITGVQFLCGGALISDRYVLTAGHCISSRDLGPITYVLVGALRRSDSADRSKIYKVKNIIKHPGYNPPVIYNDIALIETEKTIRLDEFLVPACLPAGYPIDEEKVLVTGWGLSHYSSISDTPQKEVAEIGPEVNWNWSNWLLLSDKSHQEVSCYRGVLHKFSTSECKQKYQPYRLMKQGFDEQSQTCYGDKTKTNTCQGDSGGPIQIKSTRISCTYNVVGVSSFGSVGEPGIYNRVLNYVPWIESIVWPN